MLQALRMSAQQRYVRWKINYAHKSQKWFLSLIHISEPTRPY